MARQPRKTTKSKTKRRPVLRLALRWLLRGILVVVVLGVAWIALYAVVAPPTTPYMIAERHRLGEVRQVWRPMEEISPHLARAVVAAEDANFCLHSGFDMDAIRAAISEGMNRGGSTISQQVVKNAFLWQGRSWARKALEGLMTPVMELIWTKARVLEVYLNIVEFDEGVFGGGGRAALFRGVGGGAEPDPGSAAGGGFAESKGAVCLLSDSGVARKSRPDRRWSGHDPCRRARRLFCALKSSPARGKEWA